MSKSHLLLAAFVLISACERKSETVPQSKEDGELQAIETSDPQKEQQTEKTQTRKSKPLSESERLANLMPQSGYENLGRERFRKMDWGNMPGLDISREYAISNVLVGMGPTGVLCLRDRKKMTYVVKEIEPGSPSDGKLQIEDVVVGVNNKLFTDIPGDETFRHHFPNLQFGHAIEEAEGKENGLLKLLVKRKGETITVGLNLLPIGTFGDAFPKKNAKADWLIDLNARILAAKQRPDGWMPTGWEGPDGRGSHDSMFNTSMAGLALMVADAEKYRDQVKRIADAFIKIPGKSNGFEPWYVCNHVLFLAEYYLRYGDERAKSKIEALAKEAIAGSNYYEGTYGWGHNYTGGDYSYGGIAMTTMHSLIAISAAERCGIQFDPEISKALAKTVERISADGYIDYGRNHRPRDTYYPIEKFNQHAGRTAMGAVAYRMFGGRTEHIKKMLSFLEANEAYNDSCHGGGHEFSWVWSTLAFGILDDERYGKHMNKWKWYFNFNRKFDGGFYVQPDPACIERRYPSFGPTYMAATYMIALGHNRHNLLITRDESKLPKANPSKDAILPGYEMTNRHQQLVYIAGSISMMGNKAHKSMHTLLRELKAISKDDPYWEQKAAEIYKKHLEPAIRDLAKSSLSQKQKAQIAIGMLGTAFHITNHELKAENGKLKIGISCFSSYIDEYLSKIELKVGKKTYQSEILKINQWSEEQGKLRETLDYHDPKEGIFVHAPSQLTYSLKGKYQAFTACAGIWTPLSMHGSVKFEVYGDGKRLYESPLIAEYRKIIPISVDVKGIDKLEIKTTNGGDGNGADHSIWFDPYFIPLTGNAKPVLVKDALSSKAGWKVPTQDQTPDGRPLDQDMFLQNPINKREVEFEMSQAEMDQFHQSKSLLSIHLKWKDLNFTYPIELNMPVAPAEDRNTSVMPWQVVYGPYEGKLLEYGATPSILLPQEVIFESSLEKRIFVGGKDLKLNPKYLYMPVGSTVRADYALRPQFKSAYRGVITNLYISGQDLIQLAPKEAKLHGKSIALEMKRKMPSLGSWHASNNSYPEWEIKITKAGTYKVFGEFSHPHNEATIRMQYGDKHTDLKLPGTRAWDRPETQAHEAITFNQPGTYKVSLKESSEVGWKPVQFFKLTLALAND